MDVFCHTIDLLPIRFYMNQHATAANAQFEGLLNYAETFYNSESWRLGKYLEEVPCV